MVVLRARSEKRCDQVALFIDGVACAHAAECVVCLLWCTRVESIALRHVKSGCVCLLCNYLFVSVGGWYESVAE